MIKIEKQLREFLVRAGHYTDKQGIAYRTAKGLNQIEQKNVNSVGGNDRSRLLCRPTIDLGGSIN